MKKTIITLSLAITVVALSGCTSYSQNDACDKKTIENKILTQEEQKSLTPEKVIEILKQGNDDFVNGNIVIRNTSERIRDAVSGQYPKAMILSCMDSRVPTEDIFHRGIGDIFVGRVAGNISNVDLLGSMEYACKASGSKVIVVLGHGDCGAIKSAIKNVELGNITELLAKIKPAIEVAKKDFSENATYKNHEFVEAVCKANVILTIEEIRKNSPILKEMEDNKEIKIVGAIYNMHTGKVDFL